MHWYQCLLVGERFSVEAEDRRQLMGFATTRYHKAENQDQARKIALIEIEQDPFIATSRKQSGDAVIEMEDIIELSKGPPEIGFLPFRRKFLGGGFTLYEMNEDE